MKEWGERRVRWGAVKGWMRWMIGLVRWVRWVMVRVELMKEG